MDLHLKEDKLLEYLFSVQILLYSTMKLYRFQRWKLCMEQLLHQVQLLP